MWKTHGIDSHVLFVDLIKAFDTVNHDLLFALLGKYGAPPLLVMQSVNSIRTFTWSLI